MPNSIRSLGGIVLLVIAAVIFVLFYEREEVVLDDSDVLILEQKTSYGEGSFCTKITRLYDSGKLFSEGCDTSSARLISETQMAAFYAAIEETNIFSKKCSGKGLVMDFSETYAFYVDGQKKVVHTGGCEEELKAIKATLNDL